MCQSNDHSAYTLDQTGTPSSVESPIDDVVISHGQILMDWLNDVPVDTQNNPKQRKMSHLER